jgi:hypothetical protein
MQPTQFLERQEFDDISAQQANPLKIKLGKGTTCIEL